MEREILFKNKYKLTTVVLGEFANTATKGTRLVGYFIAGMSLFFAYSEYNRNYNMLAISLGVISIVAVIYSLMLPRIILKNFEKDDNINKNISKDIIVDIGYDSIILNEDGIERNIFYSSIIAILENKEYFYLMTGKTTGVILGKDYFIDGSSEEFRKFIQSKFVRPKASGG